MSCEGRVDQATNTLSAKHLVRYIGTDRSKSSVRIRTKFRTLHNPQSRQRKANSAMTDTTPTTENRTLPKRLPNSAYRVREYLTEKEVDRLIEAARKRGRNGPRDAAATRAATRLRRPQA
jgi:hypothetical protein